MFVEFRESVQVQQADIFLQYCVLLGTPEVPLFTYIDLNLSGSFHGILAPEESSKIPFTLTYLLFLLLFIVHESMLFALAGLTKIYNVYSFPFPS